VNSTIVVPITASFDAAASDAASPRAVPESCACQRWTATTPAARPKAAASTTFSPRSHPDRAALSSVARNIMATIAAACNGQPGPPPNHSSRTRTKVKPADSRKATARSRTRSRACSSSANSSSPFAIISTGVDRVLDMLLSAKLESLAGELPPPECAEGGANPTESTDARASVTRVELTHQTAFYKSYLAAFARK
jgi:hypothetical protein